MNGRSVHGGPRAEFSLPTGQECPPHSLWSQRPEQTDQAYVSGQGPLGRGNEENICLASGLREARRLLPPQAEFSPGPGPQVECPCTYLG